MAFHKALVGVALFWQTDTEEKLLKHSVHCPLHYVFLFYTEREFNRLDSTVWHRGLACYLT